MPLRWVYSSFKTDMKMSIFLIYRLGLPNYVHNFVNSIDIS